MNNLDKLDFCRSLESMNLRHEIQYLSPTLRNPKDPK